jgi:hypothetical protein
LPAVFRAEIPEGNRIRPLLRNDGIGFVFFDFLLVDYFSLTDSVRSC